MTSPGPPEADELYALPPGEFTRARDELAKRLRADGRRPEADAVRGLRNPTLPAWTANQLARRSAAEVERLVRAGTEFQKTQKPAALKAERAALTALVASAKELLREAGRGASDSVVGRVRATLQAAAADEQAGAALREGRLERELEPGALEALLAAGAAAMKKPRKQQPRKRKDDRVAREALREARAAARGAEAEERQARKAWEDARRRLDAALERVAETEAEAER